MVDAMRERSSTKPRSNTWALKFGARPSFGVGHRRVLAAEPPAAPRAEAGPRPGRRHDGSRR